MRRLPGYSYTGPARYTLRFCTLGRRLLFADPVLVDLVLAQILRAATSHDFNVVAYCFMPDHLHLLVEAASDAAGLEAFVKDAKQRSSFHAGSVVGGRLWQAGYHERVLRSNEETRALAAYILQNPVRAGLVDDACEYRFNGSPAYSVRALMEYVLDETQRRT